jgi:hypothetical protein
MKRARKKKKTKEKARLTEVGVRVTENREKNGGEEGTLGVLLLQGSPISDLSQFFFPFLGLGPMVEA